MTSGLLDLWRNGAGVFHEVTDIRMPTSSGAAVGWCAKWERFMCLQRVLCVQLLIHYKTVTAARGTIREYVSKWFLKYRVAWLGLPLSLLSSFIIVAHCLYWISYLHAQSTCSLVWNGILKTVIGIFTWLQRIRLFSAWFPFSTHPQRHPGMALSKETKQASWTGEF